MSYNSDNLISLSSLSQSSPLEELPSCVVENLDIKYICVKCRHPLSQPWQTACGHRLCKACLDDLFSTTRNSNQGIPCPAQEEGCEVITRDKVYPDFSAAREMRLLRVNCKYSSNGCRDVMPWGKLREHLVLCRYRLQPCAYCHEEVAFDVLEQHINTDCPMFLLPCPFGCREVPAGIMRQQLEAHKEICSARPRKCQFESIGCYFKGSEDEMVIHEVDFRVHLEILIQHSTSVEQDNTRLKTMLQEVQKDMSALKVQLQKEMQEKTHLINMIGKLKEDINQLEQRQLRLSTGQGERLTQVETQVGRVEARSMEVVQLKARQDQQESKLVQLEKISKTSVSASIPEDFKTRFGAAEKTIVEHQRRVDELDMRTQCLETSNYSGVLIWKINNYSSRKKEAISGRILSLYSQPFYTTRYGFKMCARVYLNGDGSGRGQYLSMFFVIMQGDYDDILLWPFRQKVTLTLLDQKTNRRHHSDTFQPDPTSSSFQKPITPMNIASGCPRFIEHGVLENGEDLYLRNDTLYLKVVVDITNLLEP